MKLFLDDIRTPDMVYPSESFEEATQWVIVRDPEHFYTIFTQNYHTIDVVSLDHDLGDHCKSGYQVLLDIVDFKINELSADQSQIVTAITFLIHSANPPGHDRMTGVIERYLNEKR